MYASTIATTAPGDRPGPGPGHAGPAGLGRGHVRHVHRPVADQQPQLPQSLIQPQDDELMDFALSQLINDTGDPRSVIRGHSLARDMYGNDATSNGYLPLDPIDRLAVLHHRRSHPDTAPPNTLHRVDDQHRRRTIPTSTATTSPAGSCGSATPARSADRPARRTAGPSTRPSRSSPTAASTELQRRADVHRLHRPDRRPASIYERHAQRVGGTLINPTLGTTTRPTACRASFPASTCSPRHRRPTRASGHDVSLPARRPLAARVQRARHGRRHPRRSRSTARPSACPTRPTAISATTA